LFKFATLMPITSVPDLLQLLRSLPLLEPEQLAKVEGMQHRVSDPRMLARKLIEAGWLTSWQVNWLFDGKGKQLVLGGYVLLDKLGEGGMGVVYKARHRMMGRTVAVKLIRKDRVNSASAVRRFQREVRAAAQLSHPNVVHAYDADQVGDSLLLVMEYVDGTDLARLIQQRGPLPVEEACWYCWQAALGLQHAHEKGLVHRDIKPHNLLLATPASRERERPEPSVGPGSTGTIKILDMGLARLVDPGDQSSSTLTQEGAVMGSLDYLAPEQAADAHQADIRSDLYSLGCTFYQMLAGQVPFPGGNNIQKLYRHMHEEPRPIEQFRSDVPAEISAVVRRLLAKQPQLRFQTPAELAQVLRRFLASRGFDPGGSSTIPVHPSFGTQLPSESPTDTLPVTLQEYHPAARAVDGSYRWLFLGCGTGIALVFLTALFVLVLTMTSGGPGTTGSTSGRVTRPAGAAPQTVVNSAGMKLVLIPEGKFSMGSLDDLGAEPDEKPQHPVAITRAFYLGTTEVTQAQCEKVIGNNPAFFRDSPEHPVEQVSWDSAVQFCRKLSELPAEKQAGRVYRLPTEAEWEYACRAGSTTPFQGGITLGSNQAHFDKILATGRTARVGSFAANPWGLFDMHGNVWEWCADVYDSGYYRSAPAVDPKGPPSGHARVIRGGGYTNSAAYCRSATRGNYLPNFQYRDIGFRVACDVP
jgi:serine/threonine protein kinase